MYRDRIREHGESMAAARRHVGALLDIKPATLRNWVEKTDQPAEDQEPAAVSESEELKVLRREVAELRRANDILRTASAFTEAFRDSGIAGSIGSVGDALDCSHGIGDRTLQKRADRPTHRLHRLRRTRTRNRVMGCTGTTPSGTRRSDTDHRSNTNTSTINRPCRPRRLESQSLPDPGRFNTVTREPGVAGCVCGWLVALAHRRSRSIRPRRTAATSRGGMYRTAPFTVIGISWGAVAFHCDRRWRVLAREVRRLGTAMLRHPFRAVPGGRSAVRTSPPGPRCPARGARRSRTGVSPRSRP